MNDFKTSTGLAICGDLMPGRHVLKEIRSHGFGALFEGVREAAGNRPIVANLECPLVDEKSGKKKADIISFSAPGSLAKDFAEAGIGAFSLANNHILDQGEDGLFSTIGFLREVKIPFTGAGATREEALRPVVFEIGGRRLGILGLTYIQAAKENRPGVAPLYDEETFKAIERASGHVDHLIIIPHSGIELFPYPLPRDQRAYRQMIDHGADLVIGSHSHCVQVCEIYEGHWIYYGIGDSLFDHHVEEVWQRFWDGKAHPGRFGLNTDRNAPKTSLMVYADIDEDGMKVTHRPMRMAENPVSRLLAGADLIIWEQEFEALNEQFNTDPEILRRRQEIEDSVLNDLKRRNIQ